MRGFVFVLAMLVAVGDVQERPPWSQARRAHAERLLQESRRRNDRRAMAHGEALLALIERDTGNLDRAEAAAERLAAWGGESFQPLRDEILGLCAWSRSLAAERMALRPEAGAPAWDAAILFARSALDHWKRAAMVENPAPHAVRNAERAWVRIHVLTAKKAALARRKRAGGRKPGLAPPGDPRGKGKRRRRAVATRQVLNRLSAGELSGLRRLLRRKAAEKRAAREARRRASRMRVERDW